MARHRFRKRSSTGCASRGAWRPASGVQRDAPRPEASRLPQGHAKPSAPGGITEPLPVCVTSSGENGGRHSACPRAATSSGQAHQCVLPHRLQRLPRPDCNCLVDSTGSGVAIGPKPMVDQNRVELLTFALYDQDVR